LPADGQPVEVKFVYRSTERFVEVGVEKYLLPAGKWLSPF